MNMYRWNRRHRLFVWKNWTRNSFAVMFDGMQLLQWNCRSFNIKGIIRIFPCLLHAEPLFIANGERTNMPHLYDARPDDMLKKKMSARMRPVGGLQKCLKNGFHIFANILSNSRSVFMVPETNRFEGNTCHRGGEGNFWLSEWNSGIIVKFYCY